uniref:hypothetical protein n=1 Tax=Scandinavium goeteborgense TaxID=1851514 RepID=UPI00135BD46B|nr:hypothetical protein [Scandinavium goeteborgense]
MKVEGWNKLLVATVIVLLWVAILALIKVLFSDSNGFEWGSVSDWISVLCNIVMAGAALYAAINAKDWLSEKTRTLGLEKAESLLNEMDSVSPVHDSFINVLAEADLYYRSNFFENQADKAKVIISLDELRISIENNKLKLEDVMLRFHSLKRWDVKILKENELMQLLDAHQNTIMSLSNATFNLRNALSEFIDDKRFFVLFGNHFNEYYAEALSSYQNGISIHGKIHNYKFRELFEV